MRFKQAIQIGDNVTDIMRLPCIRGAFKYPFNEPYNRFPLRGHHPKKDEIIYCLRLGAVDDFAQKGEWICEDYNGDWHILNNKEYINLIQQDNE